MEDGNNKKDYEVNLTRTDAGKDAGECDTSNALKAQVDSMYKEFNSLIDQVYDKINAISKSVGDLEAKLSPQVENKSKL